MGTKVKPLSHDENDDITTYTPLGKIMKPIHLSMQLFGVYFSQIPQMRVDNVDDSANGRINFKSAVWKWYCITMTVLSGLSVARYIPAFWVGINFVPGLTVYRIITFAWLLQCFLNRVFMLRACGLRSHIPTFYKTFNDIMTNTTRCCIKINSKCNQSKKCVLYGTIITGVIIVLNAGFILIQAITDIQENFTVGVTNPFPDQLIVKIFFFSFHIFEGGAWIFPLLFQVTLFGIIKNQFCSLTDKICKMIKDDKDGVIDKIRGVRLKHLQLCKVIEILEQDTKYLITGNYVTNIFLICFFVYQMAVHKNLSWIAYVTFSSWLITNCLITAVVSITAALVNEQAHSSLDYIYDVSVNEASLSDCVELQLFLSKLTGPPIGFTAAGLITITKELLLTLGGIFLTYFFLLMQFHI